ncbi:MAG: metalloregulator ArsR/SmtB family transcription factor [Leptospirales bacterium]
MNIFPEQWFLALGHPVRLRCLMLIAEKKELCVCELSDALALSQPAISRQMAGLKNNRIVADRRQGTWIFYQLHPDLPDWCREVLLVAGTSLRQHPPFSDDSKRFSIRAERPFTPCGILPAMTSTPFHLLFLCTGNSCRSQMAEGWSRALSFEGLSIRSAGTHPHPDGINPLAIAAMNQSKIDISRQQSTLLDSDLLFWADLVVTVCGEADEICPVLPPGTRKEHWPLPDPDHARGTSREIFRVFCQSRDAIEERVRDLLSRIRSDIQSKNHSGHPESTPKPTST